MPGSDIYLCQETLYQSESCKRKLRKTYKPVVLQGWPVKIINATFIMPSPADPPSCCLLHFLHIFRLSFIIGMPNRGCVPLPEWTGMDIITGMENRNGHYAMVLDGLNIFYLHFICSHMNSLH